jgi:hypothetical protein
VELEVLRLNVETTPKLDSPLLISTPMNYAFAFAMNCCVCGFDANYYVDLMLKLCKCLHIAVLHETCLKSFFTGQGACRGDQRTYLQPVKRNILFYGL